MALAGSAAGASPVRAEGGPNSVRTSPVTGHSLVRNLANLPPIHGRARGFHGAFTRGSQLRTCRLAWASGPERRMDNEERTTIRLPLTALQRELIRRATGSNLESLTLTAEELESRIAPAAAIRWQGLD